ncbi:unnamed protein product [Prunus brigantina]
MFSYSWTLILKWALFMFISESNYIPFYVVFYLFLLLLTKNLDTFKQRYCLSPYFIATFFLYSVYTYSSIVLN